jgi:DNA-binding NtrC family response regulator
MCNIEQLTEQVEEDTSFTYPPGVSWSGEIIETPAESLTLASAFAIHGKGTRKRTYVCSDPVSRIFVVDDEYVIASTLAVILNMRGFSARFFTRPLEALTAAQSDIPDLLISDVAMPGLSGIDLAIQMRAQHPECEILLFSGQAATLDLLEDARNQGHDFHLLLKPVHPTELLSEIGALGNRVTVLKAPARRHGKSAARRVKPQTRLSRRSAG